MSAKEVIRSVILGYAFLEHRMHLYDDVLQMLALAGTRWDPTLSVAGGSQLLLRDEPERLEDAKFKAFVPEWCLGKNIGAGSAMDTISMRGEQVEIRASLRAAHRRGVTLQAGTDAQWCDYGFSLLWELEHFVEAGLPPVEVLRIATQQAAEALGAEDDLGTLEPGKLADIVLLDENPLDDIRNTQNIWRVMKGGWSSIRTSCGRPPRVLKTDAPATRHHARPVQDRRPPRCGRNGRSLQSQGHSPGSHATWRLSWVSVACQTWPMPPSPSREVTS